MKVRTTIPNQRKKPIAGETEARPMGLADRDPSQNPYLMPLNPFLMPQYPFLMFQNLFIMPKTHF
jgi:hypothetical protein